MRLARYLKGSGIEVGPGQYPFRPPGARVRSVDRWHPEQRHDILADLAADTGPVGEDPPVEFVEPDVIADFNIDRLSAFEDSSEDFVIASHVLEHLAEPIGFVQEMHRVLKPEGLALVFLPDRHRTKDRFRQPTPLEHLVTEYEQRVQEVSEAHLTEFLKDRGWVLKGPPEEQRRMMERYRDKSIHVHCWNAQEFSEVLAWGIEHLGQQWQLVDGCLYEPPVHFEFGFLLRRSESVLDPAQRREEFVRAWNAWRGEQIASRPAAFRTRSHRLPVWTYRIARRLARRHPRVVELLRHSGEAARKRGRQIIRRAKRSTKQ